MDVLVLGGSVFVGRAVVDGARRAGHQVTVFNRGRSGPDAPAGVVQIHGDRTNPDDLERLADRRVDLVVDTSGYVPADVAASAAALADVADHYVFVSSINVFPGWPTDADYRAAETYDGDPDAGAEVEPDGIGGSESPALYGWRKVGCERAVLRAFGADRSTILRGGCIVGPHDSAIGRLPWWLDRVARGGEVLVPGPPDAEIALIDARDLAAFALGRTSGVFDTPGPGGRDTRSALMDACRRATGSDAEFTYVDDEQWLMEQGVEPWSELPLWGPAATMPSLFATDSAPAAAASLRWRPLIDTVADTWEWQRGVADWSPSPNAPGLTPHREQELLRAWHAHRPSS